ncbi:cytoskeleton-associated protein 2 [Lampetra fluviatilis]
MSTKTTGRLSTQATGRMSTQTTGRPSTKGVSRTTGSPASQATGGPASQATGGKTLKGREAQVAERRARLAAWQAQHGRTLSKRPAQVRPLGGLRTPRRAPATNASFWEAMAEEEEEAEVAEAMRVGFLGFQDALQKGELQEEEARGRVAALQSGFPGARGHAAFWL